MWFAVLSILFYLISVLRIAPILLTSQVAGADVKTKKTQFLTALAVVFILLALSHYWETWQKGRISALWK